jgi:hypothetical protein
VFTVKRPGNNRQKFNLITLVTIILLIVHFGYYSIYIVYLYGYPFCMNALTISLLASAHALFVLLLTVLAVRFKRQMDSTYLPPIIGAFALSVALVIFGLSKVVWLLYIGLSFFSASFLFCLSYSFSPLHRRFVFCHSTCAPIQDNQARQGKRIRHCVHWCGCHRVNRSSGSGDC